MRDSKSLKATFRDSNALMVAFRDLSDRRSTQAVSP
jgi:hypothetical protein